MYILCMFVCAIKNLMCFVCVYYEEPEFVFLLHMFVPVWTHPPLPFLG